MAAIIQLIVRRTQKGINGYMSTQEVFVEQFAKLFHHYREALSPEFEMTEAQPASWNAIPFDERDRIVAAARLALLDLENTTRSESGSRRYFAKPGQAEWGC